MPDPDYEKRKAREAGRQARQAAAGRDIGPPKPAKNPARKRRCKRSFKLYCETYFPKRFYLGWSPAHLRAIEQLENCVRRGDMFALGLYRGGGKTALTECAALYALSYGFRRFVVAIGATDDLAQGILAKIMSELETNALLAEDFDEVCHPIRRLERIANRARGQVIGKRPTRIEWTSDKIRLPVVKGSKASGGVIRVAGITGAVRGMAEPGPAGEVLRPDLVILDDIQTRESAKSLTLTADRIATVQADVLGLAGPDSRVAVVNLCTPIYPNDLADQMLDRDKFPEWRGERTELLVSWPKRMDLWEEYGRLRAESLKAGRRGEEATRFYLAHRAELDEGAEVSWPDKKYADEASGVQHAMNLYFKFGPRGFASEFQGRPMGAASASAVKELDADLVAERLTQLPAGEVPREATRLTAFIDCHKSVLFGMVVAWDERFGGSVIDYGPYPKQNRVNFTVADARPALAEAFPGVTSADALVYAGIKAFAAGLLGREYRREGTGQPAKVEMCLVDSGYETDAVFKACRESPFSAILIPSKGHSPGKNATPMSEWRRGQPGWRYNPVGSPSWRLGPDAVPHRGKKVIFDPNGWKSFALARLLAPVGGGGALRLFGTEAYPHQLLAEHFTAEYGTEVTANNRTWDEWRLRPGRDNHLWDCVVGCAVGASVLGLQWSAAAAAGDRDVPAGPQKPIRLSDIAREKAAARQPAGEGAHA